MSVLHKVDVVMADDELQAKPKTAKKAAKAPTEPTPAAVEPIELVPEGDQS